MSFNFSAANDVVGVVFSNARKYVLLGEKCGASFFGRDDVVFIVFQNGRNGVDLGVNVDQIFFSLQMILFSPFFGMLEIGLVLGGKFGATFFSAANDVFLGVSENGRNGRQRK